MRIRSQLLIRSCLLFFRNQTYPIHPIDLVVIADQGENPRTDASDFICIGAFSYLDPGSTDIGEHTLCQPYVRADICADFAEDIILGDTFMRNVYTLYNFGNWTRAQDESPYIQLLSVRCPLCMNQHEYVLSPSHLFRLLMRQKQRQNFPH